MNVHRRGESFLRHGLDEGVMGKRDAVGGQSDAVAVKAEAGVGDEVATAQELVRFPAQWPLRRQPADDADQEVHDADPARIPQPVLPGKHWPSTRQNGNVDCGRKEKRKPKKLHYKKRKNTKFPWKVPTDPSLDCLIGYTSEPNTVRSIDWLIDCLTNNLEVCPTSAIILICPFIKNW